jgi:thymidine kinase
VGAPFLTTLRIEDLSVFRHQRMDRGNLRVVVGPMFAGKTEYLIRAVAEAEEFGATVAVVKPAIDTRNPGLEIISHAGTRVHATTISRDAHDIPEGIDMLAIDEVQFFSFDAVPKIVEVAYQRGVHVVACGLDLDAFGHPFGPVPALLAFADEVVKLRGTCARCGASSARSHRNIKSRDAILVGGADMYEPRCVGCFTPAGT